MNSLVGSGVAVLLCSAAAIGCYRPASEVVDARDEGEGTARVYLVPADQAHRLVIAALRKEGAAVIEEYPHGGYVLAIFDESVISGGTNAGVWIEPVSPTRSKITIVTQRRRR